MRVKVWGAGCIAAAIICLISFEYGQAASESAGTAGTAGPPKRIGVVSVQKAFNESNRTTTHLNEGVAEQAKLRAEYDDLDKAVSAAEAEIGTVKQGTPEYMAMMKTVIEKRAERDSRKEWIQQSRLAKDKQWTEQTYQEILGIVKQLAKERNLDLVLERTEPEFPTKSGDQLMMLINTHKVLYCEGTIDLTAEVAKRLDAKLEQKP